MSAQSDTVIQVTCSDLRTVNVKTVILVKYQSSLHDFEGDKDDKDRTNTTYFHHPEFFFRNWMDQDSAREAVAAIQDPRYGLVHCGHVGSLTSSPSRMVRNMIHVWDESDFYLHYRPSPAEQT